MKTTRSEEIMYKARRGLDLQLEFRLLQDLPEGSYALTGELLSGPEGVKIALRGEDPDRFPFLSTPEEVSEALDRLLSRTGYYLAIGQKDKIMLEASKSNAEKGSAS